MTGPANPACAALAIPCARVRSRSARLFLLIREEGLKSSAGLRKLRLFQQSHTRLLGFRQDEATRIGGGGNEIARLRAEAKSLQTQPARLVNQAQNSLAFLIVQTPNWNVAIHGKHGQVEYAMNRIRGQAGAYV